MCGSRQPGEARRPGRLKRRHHREGGNVRHEGQRADDREVLRIARAHEHPIEHEDDAADRLGQGEHQQGGLDQRRERGLSREGEPDDAGQRRDHAADDDPEPSAPGDRATEHPAHERLIALAEAAARYGFADHVTDWRAIVADDRIGLFDNVGPNDLHGAPTIAAAEAGKHVICEKPLALDAEGAERLVKAAAEAGRQATVPFIYRYYPTLREARERVRDGRTGPIRLLHGTYLQDWLLSAEDHNWRVEEELGGASRAFADIGSHWCDLAEFVSGHRIARLSARVATAHPERRRSGAGLPHPLLPVGQPERRCQ